MTSSVASTLRSISQPETNGEVKRKFDAVRTLSDGDGSWKGAWTKAALKAKDVEDPWKKYDLPNACETERARRYRYNALEKKWKEDITYIKIQKEPFARGAMRECFRLKKLSTFSGSTNWSHAANYVAKKYLEPVPDKTYFDDVRLQMDAKVWGEEFNRKDPPKKVDIFQMYVIELMDREDCPFYHLEHYIEGHYVKYNSNSGFVLSESDATQCRHTPQAFSHFSFERSGHQLIVVDIQGVGDLYTDPQIHTSGGTDYGEANLGVNGMALFFSSHHCNEICKKLQLAEFDLSELEYERLDAQSALVSDASTHVRGEIKGNRKISAAIGLLQQLSSTPSLESQTSIDSVSSSLSESDSYMSGLPSRVRLYSDQEDYHSPSSTPEADTQQRSKFLGCSSNHLGSSVKAPDISNEELRAKLYLLKNEEDIIDCTLGEVHLSMARYNELGRFTENEPDLESAMFHLLQASHCGNIQANRILGQIYLQLPHDMLDDYHIEQSKENNSQGIHFIEMAAACADLVSIQIAAKAYDTGAGLAKDSDRSWITAVKYYEMALEYQIASDSNLHGLDEFPHYKINERLAEMYREGGHGLEKDPNKAGELYNTAAELAINSMKGKLANKYYMLAEEAWGEVEE